MKNMVKIMSKRFFAIVFISAFFLSCKQEAVLYVSPTGNDTSRGTKSEPLKSMDGARLTVRNLLKENPKRKITVYFSGGTYPMVSPVKFSAEDSGSTSFPVVYKAIEDETPVFSGSIPLRKWKLLDDNKLIDKLAAGIHQHIYVADLKEAGIAHWGDPIDAGKRPELICNGQVQTLARWPNESFIKSGAVKGKTPLPPNYLSRYGTEEGIFEYIDTYQNRWANEPDICLGGYWFWDWSEEYQKVSQWDTLTHTVLIKEPYHLYGYRDSLRYFGLNLFCEIDQPGEWYLNRNTGKLYWYPPEETDPLKATVSLTNFSDPYMVEMEDCSNVTLDGLTFMEGRGSAILIKGGTNNLLTGCRIERFGRDGIHIQGGSTHGVSGCYLSTFGYGGMKIKGGDRKTLTPGNHFVEHTVIEHFSLFKRTYEPAIHLDGCGMQIANNLFRHSSSSAMRLEGNDFIIEYNEVNHVVNESDDQGGIDIYYNPSYRGIIIRYNHWADIKGGTHHGAAGIRLDDMISGVLIYGNLFERAGALNFGGVQIHGGKDNIVENNIFYQCPSAVSFNPWGEKRWLSQLDNPVIQKKLYKDVDILSEVYQRKYPELKHLRENPDANTITNNLIIDCQEKFANLNQSQTETNNITLQSEDRGIKAFCEKEILDQYGLQPIPVEKIGPKNNRWLTKAL